MVDLKLAMKGGHARIRGGKKQEIKKTDKILQWANLEGGVWDIYPFIDRLSS
ncbi:hypothetical protein [Paenibacillus physcomitrellae]|uniref:hypothetical protein n=1 Tax=Paenibacillus physcomitrellae TaxID=1619311 RepID=UPI00157FACBA|nr:hypothetical protein [Paenibacillus physcomitrellae]